MEGYTQAGHVDEFKDRHPRDIVVSGLHIIVVKVDGELIAFENSCPHQHFSLLHQGTIEGCAITCPMHSWTFDMKTGVSTNGSGKLKKFEVRSADGRIWIENVNSNQAFPLFD